MLFVDKGSMELEWSLTRIPRSILRPDIRTDTERALRLDHQFAGSIVSHALAVLAVILLRLTVFGLTKMRRKNRLPDR